MNDINEKVLEAIINQYKYKPPADFKEYLNNMVSSHPVYLYGAGAFGRETLALLKANDVNVRGFFDKNAYPGQTMLGLPVYAPNPDNISKHNANDLLLIVSIVLNHEERETLFAALYNMGFTNLIDGQSIRARQVPFSAGSLEADIDDTTWQGRMYETLELFEDTDSREVYIKNLTAHLSRDYSAYAASNNCCQYFPQDVPLGRGYTNVVDCGAYNGDTLLQLINKAKVCTYVGFEPETSNFQNLVGTASLISDENLRVFLYPCAVSNVNRMSFITAKEGSSAVADSGTHATQLICIDDVLPHFEPTFVKMDVEGAETDALIGAKKIICDYRPDLAICVYHYVNDIFEIPLMLHQWGLGYKFYLRAHSSCTMETVLYATV